MKIGLISINMYSKGLNFACPLHTFAFQQFLLKNGIENTIIDYKPVYYDNFNLKHPYDYYAKKCDFLRKKANLSEEEKEKLAKYTKQRDSWEPLYHEREVRYDKFQNFIETNYIKTDVCYDSDLLEIKDPGYDCYICATDVIWKNQPNIGHDRGYFLASKAMDNKWKISYAASRGVYFASSKEENDEFFRYLSDIDVVSVREQSLKDYIEENSDIEAKIVLDPVLLHEKEFYDNFLVKPQEDHYILLYYVMEKAEDTICQAVRYARAHHMKIVEITDVPVEGGRLKKYEDIDKVFRYDIGIEEWLGYFQYADCIFTNSFHACCFSILFEKKLFVGTRHGDKVMNVLRTFGLEERKVDLQTDLINHEPPEIDYNVVRKILKVKREESVDFILSAIHELEGKRRTEKDYDSYRKSLTCKIRYNTQQKSKDITWRYKESDGEVVKLPSGSIEFTPAELYKNDGTSCLVGNKFQVKGDRFLGWKLRIRIDNRWFWYLEDGTLVLKGNKREENDSPVRIFKAGEQIPYIPVNHLSVIVAEAVWQKNRREKMKQTLKRYVKRILRK